MPKITEINIQNLRGLQDVTLKDARLLNLIVGPSEIGKTSVLEGLFIGTAAGYLPGFFNINYFRGAQYAKPEELVSGVNTVFRNMTEKSIAIKLKIEAHGKKYGCDMLFEKITNADALEQQVAISGNGSYALSQTSALEKIKAAISLTGDITGTIEKEAIVGGAKVTKDIVGYGAHINENYGALNKKEVVEYFPTATFNVGAHDERRDAIENIIRNKKKPDALAALKKINLAIEDFGLTARDMYIDIGLRQQMPLYTAGGGAREVLLILGALCKPANILLDDEIGKGVYYGSLKTYLQAVLVFAKEQKKQIFATTHNRDVLVALQAAAQDDADLQEDIMCYTMERDRHQNVVVYPYAYGEMEHCIKNGIEIR